ncbi:transport permease protein [Nocardioides psychrotolerans]|uniref:ABC-2 type transport system permease protein n=1 Tax=Nocardioides psychrotolerans TaxID=1005945 RepID=A0A1I3B9I5_9ACTN|nr:ABC transporter permease [Nocardioides psychrotolerans]GEP36770.1 transport permease protein [Nocardioides psychrotolerans]SFH58965.1 ABC-2 type transport system permease protein [Nocardioides psychrotolerans]
MTDTGHVPVSEQPLVAPSASNGLLGVFSRRYLLRLLVRREISARYQGSFLGLLWSYINPLTQFFIYWFIMGKLIGMAGRAENYAIHVFAGLIVVHFFVETFNAGTRSIVRNKALVKKMALPREMFPVASMLVSLFHVGPQLIILLVACLVTGWSPDLVGMTAGLLALGIVMVLGTALALLFSTANVFFRDFSSAVSILTNFVRFGVPMIYPYTLVAERFAGHTELYLANPIADGVLLMQRAFWTGTTDDPTVTALVHMPDHLLTRGVIALGGSLIVLVVAQLVFTRLENKIPERL